jgi:genome maintenance exonuclease 1
MFDHKWVSLPKLKQVNTPEGRRYEVEGTEFKYPSITTVLGDTADKSFLIAWRKRVGEEEANRVSQVATRRGTSMHKLCERYLKNEEIDAPMPTEVGKGDWSAGQLMFKHIRPALDRLNNVRILEKALYSHRLEVAGTVDCIAEHNGELAIVDFKTSKRLKSKDKIDDYFMQGAFYFNAYYEITGELPKKIVIMISVQDGTLQEFEIRGKEIIYWTERLQERIESFYYNKGIQQ